MNDKLLRISEMPILLPNLRLANRIAKSRTAQIRKDCFSEDFLFTHKNLLFYKIRIVKLEFLRLLKELIKRDSEYIDFLWKHTYFPEILIQIQSEDLAVKPFLHKNTIFLYLDQERSFESNEICGDFTKQ